MQHFNISITFLAVSMAVMGLTACKAEQETIAADNAEETNKKNAPMPTDPVLTVSDAQIIVSPVPDRPAAAYFTLKAQGRDAVLTGVDVDGAERTMLHETITENDISRMQASPSFAIKSGEKLVFERGGKHVMIFGLKDIAPEQNIDMTLRFEDGETLVVKAKAAALGAPKESQ